MKNLFSPVASQLYYVELFTLTGLIVAAAQTSFILGFATTAVATPTVRLAQIVLSAANSTDWRNIRFRTPLLAPAGTPFLNVWLNAGAPLPATLFCHAMAAGFYR